MTAYICHHHYPILGFILIFAFVKCNLYQILNVVSIFHIVPKNEKLLTMYSDLGHP